MISNRKLNFASNIKFVKKALFTEIQATNISSKEKATKVSVMFPIEEKHLRRFSNTQKKEACAEIQDGRILQQKSKTTG